MYKIQLNSEENSMTSANLAICLGQNILRRKTENLMLALKDTTAITTITDVLISEHLNIFESSEFKLNRTRGRRVQAKPMGFAPMQQTSPQQHISASVMEQLQTNIAQTQPQSVHPDAHSASDARRRGIHGLNELKDDQYAQQIQALQQPAPTGGENQEDLQSMLSKLSIIEDHLKDD